jgi:hypothetical protein
MAKKIVHMNYNPKWEVSFEYQHGKELVTPGTLVKIKSVRGQFKFEKHVKNIESGKEWIDVIGQTGYRSFYLQDFKGIIKPKKKRVKKSV